MDTYIVGRGDVTMKWLSRFVLKRPMKLIFLSLAVIFLFAVGAPNVEMATGNDTFIKRDSDAFQDNLALEEEFGGESIIVLYEADSLIELMTVANLQHMKELETRLTVRDDVFTVMSPVSIVEQMALKQSEKYEEGIEEVIEGLETMGGKLIEIGENVEQNADSNQPELSDIDAKMAELDRGLSQMVEGQTKLGEGTAALVQGYGEFGKQIKQVAENLLTFSEKLGEQTELQKQMQQEQLKNQKEMLRQMEQSQRKQQEELKQQIVQEQRHNLEAMEKQMQKQMQQELNEKLGKQKESIQEQIQRGELSEQQGEAILKEAEEQMKQQMQQKMENEMRIKKNEMEEQMRMKLEKMQQQMPQQELPGNQIMESQNGQPSEQLRQMSENLLMLSGKMSEISAEMSALPDVPHKTVEGLEQMQRGFGSQKDQLAELKQQQTAQMKDMQEMGEGLTTMGENLVTISDNLSTMVQYADVMHPSLPEEQDTLEQMVYEDNGELRSMFDEMVIDEQAMTLIVKLKSNVPDAKKSELVAEIKDYLASNPLDTAKTMVSGKPVLDDAIRSSMQESMQKMMGMAIILMIVVLSIVFRVRWRILPLVMVLIAIVGTVGLMGWLSIPITMVSIAVFPILVGLGIDYGIQFQNRYVEEIEKGVTSDAK